MTPFNYKIIHISDLHLAATANRINLFTDGISNLNEIFKTDKKIIKSFFQSSSFAPDALMNFFENLRNSNFKHDLLLITGDISTSGKDEDIEHTYDTLFNEKSICSNIDYEYKIINNLNVSLLPGNHDRYEGGNRLKYFYPEGKSFLKIFGRYWGKNVENEIFYNDRIQYREYEFFVIVKIDFSLKNENDTTLNMFGKGKVYNDIVQSLENLFEDLQKKGLKILCATHFALESNRKLELIDEHLFIKVLKDYSIKHLFCGHTHEQKIYKHNEYSELNIYCAGTLSSTFGEKTFLLHEIEINEKSSLIRTKHYVYNRFKWEENKSELIENDL